MIQAPFFTQIPTIEVSFWWMGEYIDEWRIILMSPSTVDMLGPTSLLCNLRYVSLHWNSLHTTHKDPTTRLYLPYMGREALRSQSLNSKSSLQGKPLRSRDLGQLYAIIYVLSLLSLEVHAIS